MPEPVRKCFRCGADLPRPIPENADYIIADDLIVVEDRYIPREEFAQHGIRIDAPATTAADLKARGVKRTNLRERVTHEIGVDAEGNPVQIDLPENKEVDNLEAIAEEKIEKIFGAEIPVDIQKLGLVCPDCVRPTDTIVWGLHKDPEKPPLYNTLAEV